MSGDSTWLAMDLSTVPPEAPKRSLVGALEAIKHPSQYCETGFQTPTTRYPCEHPMDVSLQKRLSCRVAWYSFSFPKKVPLLGCRVKKNTKGTPVSRRHATLRSSQKTSITTNCSLCKGRKLWPETATTCFYLLLNSFLNSD